MLEVIAHTPAWLSSSSPGQRLFVPVHESSLSSSQLRSTGNGQERHTRAGPRRNIARRRTELFVAVGKEIRWADLVDFKEEYECNVHRSKAEDGFGTTNSGLSGGEQTSQQYKIIRVPVAHDITQLVMSPQEDFLAILTVHTVHIVLLPDSSHLASENTNLLRLKTFTLGPVTHVTTQPAIATVLWHPLGVDGSCVITITEDAVVRVWEISATDRQSFDRPTLAIDLQKLADGTSVNQDFGASVARNKGFSPDTVEMEVAAACFGTRDSGDWSPMTLWIAMREGDVYALCPLLPERWSPPPMLVPSLTVSIVTKAARMDGDAEASAQSKRLSQQQLLWMSELDNQDPVPKEISAAETPVEVYSRPSKPGRIPKLQGPFDLELQPVASEENLGDMLSDIFVVGKKLDLEELLSGESEDLTTSAAPQDALAWNIVCLLSSSGRVSMCLDLDGVEAQWLPDAKSKVQRIIELDGPPSLLTLETLDTLRPEELYDESWPMFSPDAVSRSSLFITHPSSVTYVSLSPWVVNLDAEFRDCASKGQAFRLDQLIRNTGAYRQRLITRGRAKGDVPTPLAAVTIMQEPNLGYLMLSCTPHRPVAVFFDQPEEQDSQGRSPSEDINGAFRPPILAVARQTYEPPQEFAMRGQLPALLSDLKRGKYKRVITETVKLSPAMLTVLTDAHKVVADETHRLGLAAAELFRQCERLQIALRDQVQSVKDIASQVESVTGKCADDVQHSTANKEEIEKRVEVVNKRQEDLLAKVERVQKKARKIKSGRTLSLQERAWMEEVALMEVQVERPSPTRDMEQIRESQTTTPSWKRFDDARELASSLLDDAKDATYEDRTVDEKTFDSIKVSPMIRQQKVSEVLKLLERESALVDAVKRRIDRLSIS